VRSHRQASQLQTGRGTAARGGIPPRVAE
jgi:hypothetical protein